MGRGFSQLNRWFLLWLAGLLSGCFLGGGALASPHINASSQPCPLTDLARPALYGPHCPLPFSDPALSALVKPPLAFYPTAKPGVFDLHAVVARLQRSKQETVGVHSDFPFLPPTGERIMQFGLPSMCCIRRHRLPTGEQKRKGLGVGAILQGSAAMSVVLYVALLSRFDLRRRRSRILYRSASKANKVRPPLRLMARQLVAEGAKHRANLPRLPLRVLRNEWRVAPV